MMAPPDRPAPEVSVIVLNRDRPHLLPRVLSGIAQLDYRVFEVIVVGDCPNGHSLRLPELLFRDIRYFHCAEANISKSRNIGIRAARGEIVAFVDDDAVPERDWLSELVVPFSVPEVGAVGGLVRGEDGIAVQWGGAVFDRTGAERPLIAQRSGVRVFPAIPGQQEFAGLMGVNTAFRRSALLEIGGFDESFHYYLDETDVALRLAEAGWSVAFNPNAEVHHFHASNESRGRLRCPRNFHQIGASKAYFCKRHTPRRWLEETIQTFVVQKQAEMDPYIRLGLLHRASCARLHQQLVDGFLDGLAREPILPLRSGDHAFGRMVPFASRIGDSALSIAVVAGWGLRHGRRLTRFAQRLSTLGHRVSLFTFQTGSHPRRVIFDDGVWHHRGGTWRFDHRDAGRLVIGRARRTRAEIGRVGARRVFDLILFQRGLDLGFPENAVFAAPGLEAPLSVHGTSFTGEDLAVRLARLGASLDPGKVPVETAGHAAHGSGTEDTRDGAAHS